MASPVRGSVPLADLYSTPVRPTRRDRTPTRSSPARSRMSPGRSRSRSRSPGRSRQAVEQGWFSPGRNADGELTKPWLDVSEWVGEQDEMQLLAIAAAGLVALVALLCMTSGFLSPYSPPASLDGPSGCCFGFRNRQYTIVEDYVTDEQGRAPTGDAHGLTTTTVVSDEARNQRITSRTPFRDSVLGTWEYLSDELYLSEADRTLTIKGVVWSNGTRALVCNTLPGNRLDGPITQMCFGTASNGSDPTQFDTNSSFLRNTTAGGVEMQLYGGMLNGYVVGPGCMLLSNQQIECGRGVGDSAYQMMFSDIQPARDEPHTFEVPGECYKTPNPAIDAVTADMVQRLMGPNFKPRLWARPH